MLYRQPSTNHENSPELRLVLAVFEDAVRAAIRRPTGRSRRAQREYLEAWAWVQGTDRAWPFAFPNVCDLLGLDPDAVRQQLLRGHVSVVADGRRRRSGRSRCLVEHQRLPDELHHDGAQSGVASLSRAPSS